MQQWVGDSSVCSLPLLQGRGSSELFPISSPGGGGGGSRRGSRQGWHWRSIRLVVAVGELGHCANRLLGLSGVGWFRSSYSAVDAGDGWFRILHLVGG